MTVALYVSLGVVLLLAWALWRISRHVGILDLEEHARRNGISYIPISNELVPKMHEWSKPVRIRVDEQKGKAHLVELQIERIDDVSL